MENRMAAVIPVKMTSAAKTRLAPVLTENQRVLLVLDMLSHMVGVLEACEEVERVLVLTSDRLVTDFIGTRYSKTVCMADADGINESVELAVKKLTRDGFSSMLCLLGDLPLLTGEDVRRAARLGRRYPLVLMPDRAKSGTNGVMLSPPGLVRTRFGSGSFQAHQNAAKSDGLMFFCLETEGLARDLDTPGDLRDLLMDEKADPLFKKYRPTSNDS